MPMPAGGCAVLDGLDDPCAPLHVCVSPCVPPAAAGVLAAVFDGLCRLLHPFMPYLTEELWQRLHRPHLFQDTHTPRSGALPTSGFDRGSYCATVCVSTVCVCACMYACTGVCVFADCFAVLF